MARALLISYAGYPYSASSLMPDNGLANLAGALLDAGHSVKILDYGTISTMAGLSPDWVRERLASIYNQLLISSVRSCHAKTLANFTELKLLDTFLQSYRRRKVEQFAREIGHTIDNEKPDFVGMKLWNGDGFTGSLAIAAMIKKYHPHLPVFAGGPHVDTFREHILSAAGVFDALVYAEGEEVIKQLAEYAEGRGSLRAIPNLIYRKNGVVVTTPCERITDLNTLPLPVYDPEIYPAMRDNQKIKIIVLDETRGCPYRCYFCIQPVKSGSLRKKSAERVVAEMKHCSECYTTRAFRYAGSATPGSLMKEIARYVLAEKLPVVYTAFAHVKTTKIDDLPFLKKSGLYALFFGIESGSQHILSQSLGKKVTLNEIKKTILASREAGIFTIGSMIVPAPFDTKDTIEESLDLILEVRPDAVPVQFPGVYPGTNWASEPERFGIGLSARHYLTRAMHYKIKLLFPPPFWKPLPYTINGMPYKKFVSETTQFITSLEKEGILTGFSDDNALIARCAGLAARDFRDRSRQYFFAGDWERVSQIVATVNERVKQL